MAFEGLSEKLHGTFSALKGKGSLTEQDIDKAMREVKLALLEADVNFRVVKDFVKSVKEKSLGQDVMRSLTPAQQVIKIVDAELTELMGGAGSKLTYSSSGLSIIMMVGLQGTGKTTTCGKLASWLKTQGKRPMLVACDVYRPAAIDQLEVVGKQVKTPVFTMRTCNEPEVIALASVKEARAQDCNVLIVDTAGRLQIDQDLMEELAKIKRLIKPQEILLVVDALTGQDAVNAAEGFNEKLGIDGIVMTKMDGDSRGGAALSVKKVTGKPIKFVGMGEKMNELEVFHPDRMASRILGMGDMMTLIEQAESKFDEEQAIELERRIKKNKFTLDDFLSQMQQVKKLGGLGKIISMLPGQNTKEVKEADVEKGERELVVIEAIIQSMTKAERENPGILNANRRKRISAGSGQPVSKVNQTIKKYEESKKLMKKFMKPGAKLPKMFR